MLTCPRKSLMPTGRAVRRPGRISIHHHARRRRMYGLFHRRNHIRRAIHRAAQNLASK